MSFEIQPVHVFSLLGVAIVGIVGFEIKLSRCIGKIEGDLRQTTQTLDRIANAFIKHLENQNQKVSF